MTGPNWREAWRRVRTDWPGKLAAVLVAGVLWWVAGNDAGVTVQRSLLVPLQVAGAEADEVAVGVPARIEVVVSGPSDRMSRLDAEDVDAVLDLADVDGEFAREIDARVPTSLRLVGVVPAEVIGRLEAVRSRELPVEVALALDETDGAVESLTIEPARATVEARDPVLAQVERIVASRIGLDGGASDVVLVPVDAAGAPVPEARVVPQRARVTVTLAPRLAVVERPLFVAEPDMPGVTVESVRPDVLELVGPPDRLAAIDRVTGRVPDATRSLPSGRYDLPVRVSLPPDVAPREGATATVVVRGSASPDDASPAP